MVLLLLYKRSECLFYCVGYKQQQGLCHPDTRFLGFYTLNAANVKSCIARAKIIAAERKFLPKGTSYCKDIKIFENGVVISEIGVISEIEIITPISPITPIAPILMLIPSNYITRGISRPSHSEQPQFT